MELSGSIAAFYNSPEFITPGTCSCVASLQELRILPKRIRFQKNQASGQPVYCERQVLYLRQLASNDKLEQPRGRFHDATTTRFLRATRYPRGSLINFNV